MVPSRAWKALGGARSPPRVFLLTLPDSLAQQHRGDVIVKVAGPDRQPVVGATVSLKGPSGARNQVTDARRPVSHTRLSPQNADARGGRRATSEASCAALARRATPPRGIQRRRPRDHDAGHRHERHRQREPDTCVTQDPSVNHVRFERGRAPLMAEEGEARRQIAAGRSSRAVLRSRVCTESCRAPAWPRDHMSPHAGPGGGKGSRGPPARSA